MHGYEIRFTVMLTFRVNPQDSFVMIFHFFNNLEDQFITIHLQDRQQ